MTDRKVWTLPAAQLLVPIMQLENALVQQLEAFAICLPSDSAEHHACSTDLSQ